MSIYATLWTLQFPRTGEAFLGCEWIEVVAQGVPGHVGTPTPGYGYEAGDLFADFLPPAISLASEEDARLRAVVIVTGETKKGTQRAGQEYVDPLLILTGEEYERLSFAELHDRICTQLRAGKSRVVMQHLLADGTMETHFEDGSVKIVTLDPGT
jgi:hypothetical protein